MNPDVAVVVGWALLDEAITPTIIAGAAIILASVAFVLRQEAA